jgi:hypothetical protein
MSAPNFTPVVWQDSYGKPRYATMVVEIQTCPSCGKIMIEHPRRWGTLVPPFPEEGELAFNEQRKRAEWRLISGNTNANNEHICMTCALDGRSSFICALCGEERSSTKEMACHFGEHDQPEFLCKICYETVPAKTYQDKVNELEDRHRWNY